MQSIEQLRKRFMIITLIAMGTSGLLCITILLASLVMKITLALTLGILVAVQLSVTVTFITILWFNNRCPDCEHPLGILLGQMDQCKHCGSDWTSK